MKIIEYSDEMRSQWDHYVLHHPQGTLFHLTAWQRVIARSFGYKPLYLVAVEGMDIRGVLPLFMVSNPLMGRTLISTPFRPRSCTSVLTPPLNRTPSVFSRACRGTRDT